MEKIINSPEENYIKFEKNIINVIIDNTSIVWFNVQDVAISLNYFANGEEITRIKRRTRITSESDLLNTKSIIQYFYLS